jgi:hypothetical protein
MGEKRFLMQGICSMYCSKKLRYVRQVPATNDIPPAYSLLKKISEKSEKRCH